MNYLLPDTTRELLLVCFWLALALAGGATGYAIVAQSYGLGVQAPAIIGLLSVLVAVMLAYGFDPEKQWRPRLDPWQIQRNLMEASDQSLPAYASITRDSLMYEALIMEELGETMRATVEAMDRRFSNGNEDQGRAWLHRPRGMREAMEVLRPMAFEHLPAASARLREACERMPKAFVMLLDREEATAMLDGTTDIAVVNCGFAEACGLPGAAGYEEVAGSNLSKRNPATGKIDKDPSGKWIKGPEYRAPDLVRTLEDHDALLEFPRTERVSLL